MHLLVGLTLCREGGGADGKGPQAAVGLADLAGARGLVPKQDAQAERDSKARGGYTDFFLLLLFEVKSLM